MSELTVAERVANGVAWLDENRPGWLGDIRIERIDIASGCNCILGQTFGRYEDSPESARWAEGYSFIAVDRGFMGSALTVERVEDDERALADEWKRVIAARRETKMDLNARAAATDA